MKPLLKDLTLIFKLFQGQVQSFNNKHRLWTGVSGFSVIQNNTPLIDRIGKINKRNKSKSIMTFDFSTLYTKIPHDLLIQAYIHVGNKVFRQKIGIPIGSDPAPFFANLFLYVYESKFIFNLLKTDPERASRLRHIFRFIDDLIAINDDGELEKAFREIYPSEMEL